MLVVFPYFVSRSRCYARGFHTLSAAMFFFPPSFVGSFLFLSSFIPFLVLVVLVWFGHFSCYFVFSVLKVFVSLWFPG